MASRLLDPTQHFALRSVQALMIDEAGPCGCCYRDVPDAAVQATGTLQEASRVGDTLDVAMDTAEGDARASDMAPRDLAGGGPAGGVASTGLYAPLPVVSNGVIADYLETGFWSWFGGGPRKFNLGGAGVGANAGVLQYNVSDLTPAGVFLADQALAVYERILGIDFVKTTSGASSVDIFFLDSSAGAYADSIKHAGSNMIDRSYVNISTAWLATYGTSIVSYSFQTYLHEIGHALGLGHAGAYNGTAKFVKDTSDPDFGDNSNVFLNDSWQKSMMSYLDQSENDTTGADFAYLLGPMVADWIALGDMYGISASAFGGDTIWGFNTNISGTVFASLANYADDTAFTIIDSAGLDTLDFSGFGANQRIDLVAESVSNVGGLVGNMIVGRGVVIENAVGGSGNDFINGNAAANDLWGGAGVDTIYAGAGADSLDGGVGADKMYGGSGADEYFVDLGSDTAIETVSGANGGIDTVYSTASFTLGANLERLVLTGSGSVNATGNALANTIWGNSFANTLRGLGGADTFRNGDGVDVVIGGPGNDVFQVLGVVASSPAARDTLRAGDGGAAFELPGALLGDRFDFTLLDADSTKSGTQDFTFGALTGKARLWATNVGELTMIRGNVDGDAPPELEIAIEDGAVLASAYTSADFIL